MRRFGIGYSHPFQSTTISRLNLNWRLHLVWTCVCRILPFSDHIPHCPAVATRRSPNVNRSPLNHSSRNRRRSPHRLSFVDNRFRVHNAEMEMDMDWSLANPFSRILYGARLLSLSLRDPGHSDIVSSSRVLPLSTIYYPLSTRVLNMDDTNSFANPATAPCRLAPTLTGSHPSSMRPLEYAPNVL
jgi:hypothetical protein